MSSISLLFAFLWRALATDYLFALFERLSLTSSMFDLDSSMLDRKLKSFYRAQLESLLDISRYISSTLEFNVVNSRFIS
jgi:hypothetical protein